MLDHISGLPEVQEYEHLHDTHYYDGEDGPDTAHRLADAALAAADREVGRLKWMLNDVLRSGINASASKESIRQKMIQDVVNEKVALLERRWMKRETS